MHLNAFAYPRPNRAAVLITLLATTITLLGLASTADAAKLPLGPKGSAFYTPPSNIPGKHGKVIWRRKTNSEAVALSKAKSTKRVLYSSRRTNGKKIAVSGSISVPKGKAPKKGWPVISYAHGTTGVADICAPSRNTVGGPVDPYTRYVYPQQNEWLKAGYAVVRTDFEGLGTPGPHPYLIGGSEGRGVLDIVRAARHLDDSIGKKFLIAGHSQGGHAALFAAKLAEKWTPDLKLRGTVAYAPASHLKTQAQALPALTSPSPLSALATTIVFGAGIASQGVNPYALLANEPLVFYPDLETSCLGQLSASASLGGLAPADLLREGADTGPLYTQLDKMNPAIKSSAPIVIAQGEADATVFKQFTDLLKDELVDLGNNVTYDTYPGVGHADIVIAAENDSMAFFQQRLKGGK